MFSFIKLLTLFSFLLINIEIGNSAKSALIDLDENNWEKILQGEWMVEFFAPWCPACKALEPIWKDFSTWSNDLELSVGQVDVTKAPGLSGRFMVTALPTIFHVKNGEFRLYKGSRDKEAFITFIEEKKWKLIDPVPGWKAPDSLQMTVVAYFFKLSQFLRLIHNILMEDYGLPTWGSYFIFALATIVLGAFLGLLLVCCIDYIYPPKYTEITRDIKKKDKESDTEDEIIPEDDLVDDQSEETSNANVKKRKVPKAD